MTVELEKVKRVSGKSVIIDHDLRAFVHSISLRSLECSCSPTNESISSSSILSRFERKSWKRAISEDSNFMSEGEDKGSWWIVCAILTLWLVSVNVTSLWSASGCDISPSIPWAWILSFSLSVQNPWSPSACLVAWINWERSQEVRKQEEGRREETVYTCAFEFIWFFKFANFLLFFV